MKAYPRNTRGRFSGGMRELVVGKKRNVQPKTKPPVETIKLQDGRTTITCKPELVEFWKAKYPNLKKVAA